MYCLKVDKIKKNSGSDSLNLVVVADTQFLSFDSFEKLYKEKQVFDKKVSKKYDFQTTVYKVSNNGNRVEELTNSRFYKLVDNLESEMTDSFKSYSFLKQVFDRNGIRFNVVSGYSKDKYSKYGIMNVKDVLVDYDKVKDFVVNGKGRPKRRLAVDLEIEKVTSTPKYEVRIVYLGCVKMLFCESTQSEIVNILNRDFGIVLKQVLRDF